MYFIWLCCFVLAAAKVVLSREGIHVKCGKDSAIVTWKMTESLAETPFKLVLGECFPSKFSSTADGEREAVFHYHFSECLFRQKETPEKLIYENELIIRPLIRSDSAPVIYPIKCVTERPFPVAQPAFGVLQGQGELTFHMGLLNEDLSGPALSNTFPLGSFINLRASVVQQGHQSLMLYLEECVASNTLALEPQSWTYPIITNKGCLVDGKTGSSRFLPRNQPSSLVLQLQTFKFATEQVYIHCKLVVWDPEDLNEKNKACNYNKSIEKWELLDDPFQDDLCHCCDYDCNQQMDGLPSEAQGPAQNSVLGPLLVTSLTS
ncbi:zona pellucida glycoprotein 3f, tandem duplicate 2 [Ictalurus punctatus]|uniref:Zona pellucida glycoprotein 3f, tandem duplicate 2 n=1 Tax=Ictalurus punctatus TaxID=7998 RepID=A0A2D0RAJ1_ICTPU|nr:zona pellucida glycoprotein 3f, tandem duplicate 2 [Ictalurus punctatus]